VGVRWGEVVGKPINRDLGCIGIIAAWQVGPSVRCGGTEGRQLPLVADVGKPMGWRCGSIITPDGGHPSRQVVG